MKEIKLTQNKIALVDNEDFEWLNRWKWHAHLNRRYWYAIRADRLGQKRKTIFMHRLILEYHGFDLKGLDVDHINHDGLDNRLKNLRPATRSQNQQNQRPIRGMSPYKGVSWNSGHHKWMAQISINSHQIYLGYFDNEKSAAKIYNQAALMLFEKFACLNNI